MSEPGYLFSSSGVSFGLTPPPADAGLHRAARRDLIKDRQLVRPLPENAAQSLCMLAPRAAPAQDDRDRSFRDVDAFVDYSGCDNRFVLPAFESPQDGFSFARVRLLRDRRYEEELRNAVGRLVGRGENDHPVGGVTE